jgi:dTDP-4-dehydrorhamnose 3,5-epimerase
MNRFTLEKTPLSGLFVLKRQSLTDDRGYFERLFCENNLREALSGKRIAQINHSFTLKRGTVRGLHFQRPPRAETKIVTCLRGEVWDVAVDVRRGSPTFLVWHGEILSARNCRSFCIPEGFAHGFQTLTDDCAMLYMHTELFDQASEAALSIVDPRLAIDWPLPITGLSPRDENHALMTDDFLGIPV